jgi:hypothetical protein
LKEFVENIMRVMWAGCGLWMELHAEDRFVFHSQPFEGVIVQAFVGDFHLVFVQIPFGDALIMILRGDENIAVW